MSAIVAARVNRALSLYLDEYAQELGRRRVPADEAMTELRQVIAGITELSPVTGWKDVADRDGMNCAACNVLTVPYAADLRDQPSWDHVVPRTKGGDDSLANAQLLCRSCNSSKSDLEDLSGWVPPRLRPDWRPYTRVLPTAQPSRTLERSDPAPSGEVPTEHERAVDFDERVSLLELGYGAHRVNNELVLRALNSLGEEDVRVLDLSGEVESDEQWNELLVLMNERLVGARGETE